MHKSDNVLIRPAMPLTSMVFCIMVLLVIFYCQVRLPTQSTRKSEKASTAPKWSNPWRLKS